MNCALKNIRPSSWIMRNSCSRRQLSQVWPCLLWFHFPEEWTQPERVWKWVPKVMWCSLRLTRQNMADMSNRIHCWCPCLPRTNHWKRTCGRMIPMSYQGYMMNNKQTRKLQLYAEACTECGAVYWTTVAEGVRS